jgi:hypothetical protein
MKRFFYFALILALFSFVSCKRSEQQADQGKQQKSRDTKTGETARKKGAKKALRELQIYQQDKLVATVPHDDFAELVTADVKIEGQDYKGILLTDLLKKYNVTGKTVTLQGPGKQCTISWEQVTGSPIYVYLAGKRLQLYTDSKDLESVKLPTVLISVTAADQPAAAPAPARAKGAKKTTT